MKRGLLFGAAAAAVLTLVWSLPFGGRARMPGDTRTVIRYAHYQGMPSLVRAIDLAMRDYEALHPDVRLEQILVPDRIWRQWLQSQMIGGTPPDLVEIAAAMPIDQLAQHFTPLTEWIDAPNPYNAGTPIEGLAWKDTFLDGLATSPSYNAALGQVLGVPKSAVIIRVLFNRTLLREIAGEERVPATYAEMIELCRLVQAWSQERGRRVAPLAVSKFNVPYNLYSLFSAQTQRRALEINPHLNLRLSHRMLAQEYLRGTWTLRDEAVLSGFEIMREFGQMFTPGFLQLEREDAMFQFLQGRALMMTIGSFAASTAIQEAPFEIGVFRLPLPSSEDPRYGRHVLGLASEASRGLEGTTGLARASPHKAQAVDFLHFLTSHAQAQKFTANSGFVPAVVKVEPAPLIAEFVAHVDGPPDGFRPDFAELTNRASNRGFTNLLHELVGPDGSLETFVAGLEQNLPRALRQDLQAEVRSIQRSVQRADSVIGALAAAGGPDTAHLHLHIENQLQQETESLQSLWVLRP